MSDIGLETLGDRVLVRRHETEQMSRGGLHLPDRSKSPARMGTVIAMGTGGKNKKYGYDIPFQVKLGDTVLFHRWGGIEIEHNDETLLVMPQEEIVAVVEEVE